LLSGIRVITTMTENLKEDKKTTVLYIASPGRSGSTLMERVLNEIPSVFAAGELGRALLYRAALFEKNKARCLCGQKICECPTWGRITNDATFKTIDEKSFKEAQAKYHNNTIFLKLFLKKKQNLPSDLKQYLNGLQTLYSAIKRNQSCQIITDSSILPLYGYYLSLIPSIDLYVVHLVRDPRGVVHSWNTIKYTSKNVPWSPKINVLQAAFTWMKRNMFTEFLFSWKKGKYLRIHYEDFVENPTEIIMQIGEMLGLKLDDSLDFIDGKKLGLGVNHLVGGNIDAINKGSAKIVLKLDERWKRDMKWWKIVLVTLITWPLSLKYFIVDKMMKKKRV